MPKSKKTATKPAGAKASGGSAASKSVPAQVSTPVSKSGLPAPIGLAPKPGPKSAAKQVAAKPFAAKMAGKPMASRPMASKPMGARPMLAATRDGEGRPAGSPLGASGGIGKPAAAKAPGKGVLGTPAKGASSKSASAKSLPVKSTLPPVPPPVTEPEGPKRWPKGGPTKADLRRYRDMLIEMRRNLLASSKELASEALKSSGQDFSVDHMADHGSDNYEQDFSLKLLEGESEQLAEIRDALFKIDGKSDLPFGLCEACSDDSQNLCESCPWIPASRLEVVPHARLCVQTKEIEERRRP